MKRICGMGNIRNMIYKIVNRGIKNKAKKIAANVNARIHKKAG